MVLTHATFEQLQKLRCKWMLEALQEQLQQADITQLIFEERFAYW